jgi:HK97 gp10 family phage protein
MADMFKVDIRGIPGVRKNLAYVTENLPDWLAAANADTAEEVWKLAQFHIRRNDSYATGAMSKDIQMRSSKGGAVYAVGCMATYAPYVEFGTKPHFPPLEAIRQWCAVRGIDVKLAYPIARAIARRGIPARPFLYPAFLEGMKKHVQRIRAKVAAGLRDIPA